MKPGYQRSAALPHRRSNIVKRFRFSPDCSDSTEVNQTFHPLPRNKITILSSVGRPPESMQLIKTMSQSPVEVCR